jgi:hypothetical protein
MPQGIIMRPTWYSLILILILPCNAGANVGIPLIAIGFPFMVALLIPVLAMEAIIYKIKLNKSYWEAIKVSSIANLYSTIIGYPISWFFLFIYQLIISLLIWGIVTLFPSLESIQYEVASFFILPFIMPAWLPPFQNYPLELSMLLAGMVNFVPAYLVTVSSEKLILRKFWTEDKNVNQVCISANRASYSLLFVIVICVYVYTLIEKF